MTVLETVEVTHIPVGTIVYFVTMMWRVAEAPVLNVTWTTKPIGGVKGPHIFYNLDNADSWAQQISADDVFLTEEEAQAALRARREKLKPKKG